MRNFFQKFLIIGGILLAISSFADVADACSCYETETVDKEFAKTPNVVILKLQSIKQNEGEAVNYLLSVERVFKGELKTDEILTFTVGSNCSWMFREQDVGTEFLFYLGNRPADNVKWIGSRCSRSGRVKSKTDDLSYLKNEPKVRGKTRLSGYMSKYVSPITEAEAERYESLSGYTIKIKGNGKNIKLKTDQDGFYEIYDLPAGKYKVTPEKIDGFKNSDFENGSIEVVIRAKSHTEQYFDYKIDNRISGKIYDFDGKPLGNVRLNLSPARGKASEYFDEGCETEDDGSFDFDEIPAGTYVLVVNEDNKISPDAHFGTFYYPGVLKREQATEITIGAGDFRDGLIVNVPQTDDTIAVSGVLLFEDGNPVVEEPVYFYEESELRKEDFEQSEASYAITDENGRFTIRILKGQKGMLVGLVNTGSEKYENCPSSERLIKGEKIINPIFKTPPIQIEAQKDSTGVELKFQFPSCKKAK